MTVYASEADVISAIRIKIENAGHFAKVGFFSDEQGVETLERLAVFRAAIAMEDSEPVINSVCDIGTDTDRGIRYRGSKVEPTEAGEVRYLFFEAKINPFEEK
ncbi:hypothetical protein [Sulfurovum sp.]|uniref:hypothetical protein n=1 Tax=Sulfurovum sp. TaxID=1969726 RepID=UPI002609EA9B|nr:hypothetical protein [Sulfurovum sp.]